MNRRRRGEVDSDFLVFFFIALLAMMVFILAPLCDYHRNRAKELKRQMLKCETCRKVLEQQAIDEALGDLKKEDE